MCEWMCVCVHVERSAERGAAGSFSCSLSPSRYCTLANDPMELMASAIGHLCAINTALIPRVEARLERFYPKITTRRFDGRESSKGIRAVEMALGMQPAALESSTSCIPSKFKFRVLGICEEQKNRCYYLSHKISNDIIDKITKCFSIKLRNFHPN
jgi:hypothetical protein